MIAVKLRTRRVSEPGAPGNAPTERLAPEGLEDRADVVATSVPRDGAVQIYFCGDDAVPEGDPRRARPADVPLRDDLPARHPLYRKRALAVVPAGWPDATIDARGRVVPLDAEGKPVDIDAPPGLAVAVERPR